MARAHRQLAEAEAIDQPSECALVQADAEARVDPGGQILQPPTHHPVPVRVRPALDDLHQGLALCRVQLRLLARLLAVDQPRRAIRVEGQHPVAHRLQAHRPNPRRIGPAAAVVDLSQSQETTALARIPADLGVPPQIVGREVLTQPHRR